MNNKSEISTGERIGIMGGSFDPVHIGHVGLARDSLEKAMLDRVVIVPARIQPFKQDVQPASGQDRMNMLGIAFADYPGIQTSSYELENEGVSYTYLTLRAMQENFGQEARIFFILGTDSLLKLSTWRNSEELLSRYSYIVGSRPGYMEDELNRCIEQLESVYDADIIRIENDLYDISSTQIRQMVEEGKAITYLVGEGVERYINENGLYHK